MPARIEPAGLKLELLNKVKRTRAKQKEIDSQLNYQLLKAVEAGVSKTHLAEAVGISQPAMSKKIANLQQKP